MEKYKVIYEEIYKSIKEGKIKYGELLPKETELCEMYGASRITIRHSLKMLEEKELIERKKHVGSIVKYIMPKISEVAFVFPHFENCYERIKDAIDAEMNKHSARVTFYDSENNAQKEKEILFELIEKKVDGIILMPVDRTANVFATSEVVINKIPLVFIDFSVLGISVPLVTADGFKGVRMATRHLLEKGHKNIAFYPFEEELFPTVEERFSGYCYALTEAGIPIERKYLLYGDNKIEARAYNVESARKAVEEWENTTPRPTAIVCVNDVSATAIIEAFTQKGYSIPQDVSITGFDNFSRAIQKNITTVWQDFGVMAKVALQYVLEEKQKEIPLVTKIKTIFVERNTTKSL